MHGRSLFLGFAATVLAVGGSGGMVLADTVTRAELIAAGMTAVDFTPMNGVIINNGSINSDQAMNRDIVDAPLVSPLLIDMASVIPAGGALPVEAMSTRRSNAAFPATYRGRVFTEGSMPNAFGQAGSVHRSDIEPGISFVVAKVPEPTSISIFGIGILSLIVLRRRLWRHSWS